MPLISASSSHLGRQNDLIALFDENGADDIRSILCSFHHQHSALKMEPFELDFTQFRFVDLGDSQWEHFCTLIENAILNVSTIRFDHSDFNRLNQNKIQRFFKALSSSHNMRFLSLNGLDLSLWSEECWLGLWQLVKILCSSKENTSPRIIKKLELGLEQTNLQSLNTQKMNILILICKACSGTVHSANNTWSSSAFSFFVNQVFQVPAASAATELSHHSNLESY